MRSFARSVRGLPSSTRRLFLARIIRLFGYGLLAVVLALYLDARDFSDMQIGLLLTLTLLGDTLVSLGLTTTADRIGRKRILMLGAALMVGAGVVFASTDNYIVLVIAATLGVISPSGNEVGPFLSVEQASLSQLTPAISRTQTLAWYNLLGSVATASGALVAGTLSQALQNGGLPPLASYRVVVLAYASIGLILLLVFAGLSPDIEAPSAEDDLTILKRRFGLHRSHSIVMQLSALFALDSFAGGFILQSIIAYWFFLRFDADPAQLGAIFFGANLLAGVSALAAARIARRIGLINTMVFTHLPSNILLMLVPLMPTFQLAVLTLLLRTSISQMDVPTRQSYTLAVVAPDERSAAAGITGVARTTGAALAPVLTGPLLANPALMGLPFFIAGGLKIVYDLALFRNFRQVKPPEEVA